MVPRLMSEVAASVDATPALVPVLEDLFDGIEALGSLPPVVVRMLKRVGIGQAARVIDLGCGKGAVSVAAGETLGCRCLGVDASTGFIASARELARARGVAHVCSFRVADVRQVAGRYDAAMMVGLFDVARAARLMRKLVKPGGAMLVDDAVAIGGSGASLTLAQARAELGRYGEVIAERVSSSTEVRRVEASLYRVMSKNAARLEKTHPRLKPALRAFLERQRQAAAALRGPLRPVIWIVRVR